MMNSNRSSRPNIVVLFSDQQRWDSVSCYGRPLFPHLTPNLDQMAQEGVRFQYAFTPQPVCGPARACLQTGLYATQTGCFKNDTALPLDAVTIAKLCGQAGYETAYVGKWHLASDADHRLQARPIPEERRGGYKDYWIASDVLEFTSHGYEGYFFDDNCRRVDFEGYRVDRTADFALEYLQRYAKGRRRRPFFLFVSFIEPHHQNDLNRFIGPMGSKQRFKDYAIPGDLAGAEGDWRQQMPDYLGCCASLDQSAGRIRETLESLGLAENTLLIYTSDHGCHFRTRNAEYKRSPHDETIRIPLIVSGPGFSGGRTINDLVSLIDLPPTLLRAARARIPSFFQGRPLQELANGTARNWPKDVFVQVSESYIGRAIRTPRWKYSVWVPPDAPWAGCKEPDSKRYVEQCLYDLEADPHERNNLIADPRWAGVRSKLAAALRRRMREAKEATPTIAPARRP
jgi:uncharacterized sulfatase